MVTVLLIWIFFLTLAWQLMKTICTYRQKTQELILAENQLKIYASKMEYFTLIEERNHNLLNFYHGLGHSIAALDIQLQVVQKLWQINPIQAEKSLSEAYQLSSTLMYEVRQIVRNMGEDSFNKQSTQQSRENLARTKLEEERYVYF
ncbi:histidine kinase dimerization/phosphoacceptor domain-containing protein [Scytonema hofmannii FACHB-248]|uniref:Histidine kinase dimerization/phosphoacceptor domain-containing protein n=1 Tax=Scytonema hofmannii FACHB-248 TaxID=1842502 RepID=A0ABR8GKR6_9CYAN|nr:MULTISPECIES: histidine kinase dimerization/phosphoacceptor domain-containing protein [Nostocales]MBD2603802.1 histidine kinase dimerization/phosphoacceptor domain-containing protein [Scytonema hofmannii FACHB-248]